MKFTTLLATTAIGFLTACGGNSASNSEAVMVSDPLSVRALDTRGNQLENDYRTLVENEDFTTSAEMPVSGRATLNGVIGVFEASGDLDAFGQLDMSVDFKSKEIDGIGSNFTYSDERIALDGTLVLDADIKSGAVPGFEGTLVGDLTDFDRITIDADISGNFLGDAAQGVYGTGTGTAVGDGNTTQIQVEFAAD